MPVYTVPQKELGASSLLGWYNTGANANTGVFISIFYFSTCGACLRIYRGKDSCGPFPPRLFSGRVSRILQGSRTRAAIARHSYQPGIYLLCEKKKKNGSPGIRTHDRQKEVSKMFPRCALNEPQERPVKTGGSRTLPRLFHHPILFSTDSGLRLAPLTPYLHTYTPHPPTQPHIIFYIPPVVCLAPYDMCALFVTSGR